MSQLKPNHVPIFEAVLRENLLAKGVTSLKMGSEDLTVAVLESVRQTITDFELVPIMEREVSVSTDPDDRARLIINYRPGTLKNMLDRGRLGFYKGRGIEGFIIERGAES